MSPYLKAILIFGALGLLMLLVIKWMATRTIYKPIRPEEGGVRDEQAARDEIKQLRVKQIWTLAAIYLFLCLSTFAIIAAAPSVKRVNDALHPTATPTVTNTPRATYTPTVTRTRTPSRTPSQDVNVTGSPGSSSKGSNFLTSFAKTKTPTLRSPSGGSSGGGSQIVYVTRIVNKVSTVLVTAIVPQPVYQTVVVYQTVLVVVTPTYTPTLQTPTETAAVETETPTPTLETPTPTPETPTPTEATNP